MAFRDFSVSAFRRFGDLGFWHWRRAGVLALAVLLSCLSAEEIHVAFCLDNNFAEPTGVAAYSLCKNKASDDRLVVHVVMTEPLPEDHRRKFLQLERLFPGQVTVYIYDDMEKMRPLLRSLEGIKGRAWPIAASARLLLDRVLPENLPKVIYLDGDILVLTSLGELWRKLPLAPYALAGVPDGYCQRPDQLSQGIQKEHMESLRTYAPGWVSPFYINSGVLLLDLDGIRQEQLFPKTIQWSVEHHPKFPDQDAINVIFRDRILECEGKWNTFSTATQASNGISVMHFAGSTNPWKINFFLLVDHWWQPRRWPQLWKCIMAHPPTLWHHYRQESPWRRPAGSCLVELELFRTKKQRAVSIPLCALLAISFLLFLWLCRSRVKRRRN